eukprot:5264135-Prymnesium_polylepis.1
MTARRIQLSAAPPISRLQVARAWAMAQHREDVRKGQRPRAIAHTAVLVRTSLDLATSVTAPMRPYELQQATPPTLFMTMSLLM